MNGRDGLLNNLNQEAYYREVLAREEQFKAELLAERNMLPLVAKINEGEVPVTMPQICRALNAAMVDMDKLQWKEFTQSLARQVQQGV
jgi:hypothetical protein